MAMMQKLTRCISLSKEDASEKSGVKPCPPNYPSGYYWYGTCRKSAGA